MSPSTKCLVKVLIVDDSRVMRRRLVALLSPFTDVEIIGEASDPLKAISYIRELRPDAVILDIRNRRRSGIDILRNIRKNNPAPKVLALTNYFYPQRTRRSMDDTADFSVDKFVELNKIHAVLKQLTQSSSNEHVGMQSI